MKLRDVKEEGFYQDKYDTDTLYQFLKTEDNNLKVDVWNFDEESNTYTYNGSLHLSKNLYNSTVVKSSKKYRLFGEMKQFLEEVK